MLALRRFAIGTEIDGSAATVMERPWKRNVRTPRGDRRSAGRRLAIESLEARDLLSATPSVWSQRATELLPAAIIAAQNYLVAHPESQAGSPPADADEHEGAEIRVEIQVPPGQLTPGLPAELVEEFVEQLLHDRNPSGAVFEVTFNSAAVDGRVATLQPVSGNSPALRSQPPLALADVALAEPATTQSPTMHTSAAQQASADSELVAVSAGEPRTDPPFAQHVGYFEPVKPAAGEMSAESSSERRGAEPLNVSQPNSWRAAAPQSHQLIEHLHRDLRELQQAAERLLTELRGMGDQVAEWIVGPRLSRWVKLILGAVAAAAAWQAIHRWRMRDRQPEEEAVDLVFLQSLEPFKE